MVWAAGRSNSPGQPQPAHRSTSVMNQNLGRAAAGSDRVQLSSERPQVLSEGSPG
jgi:hypothetical protein